MSLAKAQSMFIASDLKWFERVEDAALRDRRRCRSDGIDPAKVPLDRKSVV